MHTDRVYLINSIILNGHTETIKMIVRNPFPVVRELASDFMVSHLYTEIARRTRFIMGEDGVITKIL